MGNAQIVDSMVNDGLWCSFEQCHMGNAGELIATDYNIGRAAQDDFAFNSHRKAAEAEAAGRFKAEIVPRGDPAEERRADRRLPRRISPGRHHCSWIGRAEAGVQEGWDGHRRKCSASE